MFEQEKGVLPCKKGGLPNKVDKTMLTAGAVLSAFGVPAERRTLNGEAQSNNAALSAFGVPAERRAQSESTNFYALGKKSAATRVYVFGPESSGTRFLSRTIASTLDVTTNQSSSSSWDGENPACWDQHPPAWRVEHLSLPWGGSCSGHVGEENVVVDDVDLCSKNQFGRIFTNITSTLLARPTAKAVTIVRDVKYTLPSVVLNHCSDADVALGQNTLARQLIDEAAAALPSSQLLQVDYETMSADGRTEWTRIFDFLGLHVDESALDAAVDAWVDGDSTSANATLSARHAAKNRVGSRNTVSSHGKAAADLQALRERIIA